MSGKEKLLSNRITPEQARTAYAQARCLFNEEQVENAIVQMAAKISARLSEKNPLVISVMNGGLILTGKIVTKLDFPLHLDYLHATRYRGATHGGELHWVVKPQHSLRDRHVLIIDDILDEGVTLNAILEYCKAEGAREVLSCVLVEKDHDRKYGTEHADFAGLVVEDAYVFGYGMDYKGYLRNVAGIFAIAE